MPQEVEDHHQEDEQGEDEKNEDVWADVDQQISGVDPNLCQKVIFRDLFVLLNMEHVYNYLI